MAESDGSVAVATSVAAVQRKIRAVLDRKNASERVPAEERQARFRCVIALTPLFTGIARGSSPACAADEHELATELFDGACEGRITFAPSGAKGFGYDPLFVPEGFEQSFAALGEDVKNRISHRARALQKLQKRFNPRV